MELVDGVAPKQLRNLEEIFTQPVSDRDPYRRGHDEYHVRLPNFEGPLDLLLHLIRKDQLNIYDIPIAQICRSYLEYLEHMVALDVNLAGEFLVMAATLMQLKSYNLLPSETDGDGEDEDPRLPLVAQLLEYERFKIAAEALDKCQWLYRNVYPRPEIAASDVLPPESESLGPVEPIDSFQLLVCLKVALDRTTRQPLEIVSDPLSIKEKVAAVRESLENKEVIDFANLIPVINRRRDLIVSFLVILELARLNYIEIVQHENFGPIQLRRLRSLHELDMALLEQY